jgi:hypothetical protein
MCGTLKTHLPIQTNSTQKASPMEKDMMNIRLLVLKRQVSSFASLAVYLGLFSLSSKHNGIAASSTQFYHTTAWNQAQ